MATSVVARRRPMEGRKSARTEQARIRPAWGRIATLALIVALFFSGGRFAAPETVPAEEVAALKADLARAENQIEALRLALEVREESAAAQAAAAAAAVETPAVPQITGDTYVVQPGESMAAIAEAACGDDSMAAYIATYNGLEDPALISSAVELQIPPDCLP